MAGKGEKGRTTVEDTVAAPVNRTDGRTDGWTHAHGRLFSDLTNFKDVYAKPARGDGSGEGGSGGGDPRGLGILFLSFRSIVRVYLPLSRVFLPRFRGSRKVTLRPFALFGSLNFSRFVYKNNT